MKKKTHKVVVEVSTSHPISEQEAASIINKIIKEYDFTAKPVLQDDNNIYIEKGHAITMTLYLAKMGSKVKIG